MSNDFSDLMQQIETEASAEGPDAVAELHALNAQFKLAADLLGRRQQLGLSQAALAKLCGVQQADISRIERGQGNPTVATIEKLMTAMGGGSVEIDWKAL